MRHARKPHARRNPVSRPTFRPRLDVLEGREAPGDALGAVLGLSLLGPGLGLLDASALGNGTPAPAGAEAHAVRWEAPAEGSADDATPNPITLPQDHFDGELGGSLFVNFNPPSGQTADGELDPLTQDLLL